MSTGRKLEEAQRSLNDFLHPASQAADREWWVPRTSGLCLPLGQSISCPLPSPQTSFLPAGELSRSWRKRGGTDLPADQREAVHTQQLEDLKRWLEEEGKVRPAGWAVDGTESHPGQTTSGMEAGVRLETTDRPPK